MSADRVGAGGGGKEGRVEGGGMNKVSVELGEGRKGALVGRGVVRGR